MTSSRGPRELKAKPPSSWGFSHVPAPAGQRIVVLPARLLHRGAIAHLRDGHVPPTLVARHAFVTVDRDVDDHRAIDLPRRHRRVAEPFAVPRAKYVAAQPFRIPGQVDGQPLAVAVGGVVAQRAVRAEAITGAETLVALRSGQAADRRKTLVVDKDDRQLGA